MTAAPDVSPAPRKPIRLWPGVAAVILQWLLRFVLPVFAPEALEYSVLGGVVAGLAILIWWAFFSRAPWIDRLGGIGLMVVAVALTPRVLDPSIATGMMGLMFFVYVTPILSLAFVVSVVVSRRFPEALRRATIAAAILLACGAFALLRTNGMTGAAVSDFAWRWAPTAEERLLVHASDKPLAALPPPVVAKAPVEPPVEPAPATVVAKPVREPAPVIVRRESDWPGFRGPHRDGVIPGVRIEADWAKSPPVQIWRRPIGPGWSSFAVSGDVLYTQEQRGNDEVVASYKLATGEPVWAHRDAARFWESNAGAGPRATPTLSNGRVYTFGATGIVNALDQASGAVVWSRNAGTDTSTKIPGWGFASSPLVIGNEVVIAAGGRLIAYDLATGAPRWTGPDGGYGYSSPHLITIDGVAQILFQSSHGAASFTPGGTKLWEHSLPATAAIVQPAVIADGDLLLAEGEGNGMRRIAVAHGVVEERWRSIGLKPYFSDFVVHKGFAYGFDGAILSCINIDDGKKRWKGGRYGSGQLVLLPDQDLLLVLTEEGGLALAAAAPDQFTEIARAPAIEGKTWNHPVLVGDVLLVRNGQEMAAFRLKRNL